MDRATASPLLVVRRVPVVLSLVVALLGLSVMGSYATATPGDAGQNPARIVETIELSSRLRELVIDSEALGGTTRARILLPASFGTSDQRYPVLYLLHGANNDYTRWTTGLPTEATTEGLDVIVVMPDGGPSGFYSDWYNGGDFGPPAWETYHLEELRQLLEDDFRANGRYAIAGHSMGGFGALSYASRHPDLFSAVIASSPASDNRYLEPATPAILTGLTAFDGSPPDALWGNFNDDELRWRAHNPLDLAPNLRQTPIFLSVGNGLPGPLDSLADPAFAPMALLESALYAMNVNFSGRLDELGIVPVANDLGRPGSHIVQYAHAALERWLPDVMAILERNPEDRSRSFSFRSAEDHFSVWGWTFDVERPAPAFVDVTVDGDTIVVNGTGLLRVATPAHYQPGVSYRIEVAGRDPGDVVADDRGRLRFDVDLAGTSTETYSVLADQPGPRHVQPAVTATIAAVDAAPANPEGVPGPMPVDAEQGRNTGEQGTPAGTERLPVTGSQTPSAAIALVVLLSMTARVLSGPLAPRRHTTTL
jgi:S-formylglutathione hydrolase FrmB